MMKEKQKKFKKKQSSGKSLSTSTSSFDFTPSDDNAQPFVRTRSRSLPELGFEDASEIDFNLNTARTDEGQDADEGEHLLPKGDLIMEKQKRLKKKQSSGKSLSASTSSFDFTPSDDNAQPFVRTRSRSLPDLGSEDMSRVDPNVNTVRIGEGQGADDGKQFLLNGNFILDAVRTNEKVDTDAITHVILRSVTKLLDDNSQAISIMVDKELKRFEGGYKPIANQSSNGLFGASLSNDETLISPCLEPSPSHNLGTLSTPTAALKKPNPGALSTSHAAMRRADTRALKSQIGASKLGDGNAQRKTVPSKLGIPDTSDFEDQLRSALYKPIFNQHDLYHDTGCSQAIVKSRYFAFFVLLAIVSNALWICYDTDSNNSEILADADAQFVIAEISFCSFFVAEIIFRFSAYRTKVSCLTDYWFLFDFLVVVAMFTEVYILNIYAVVCNMASSERCTGASTAMGGSVLLKLVRIVRVTRVARVARLLRFVPELVVLLRGVLMACPPVFFTMLLFFAWTYCFAVLFRQMTRDSDGADEFFESVPRTLLNLVVLGCFPDYLPMIEFLGKESFFLGVIMFFYCTTAAILILNVLVGILVEITNVVSDYEKESAIVQHVRTEMEAFMTSVDTDNSKTMGINEFNILIKDADFVRLIKRMGVEPYGLIDYAETVFKNKLNFTFPEFIDLFLDLRGAKSCSVKHIMNLQQWIFNELNFISEHFEEMKASPVCVS